jgi:hypothetical protein
MPVLLIALAVVRVEVDEREGYSNPLIGCIISSREQRIRPGGHDSWPPGESRFSSNVRFDLSIISITTRGSGHRRRDRNAEACQDPGSLTRSEARCEQSVVDLARNGKAVKSGCWEK